MKSNLLHDCVDAGDLLEKLQTAANDQSSPEAEYIIALHDWSSWGDVSSSPGGLMPQYPPDDVPGPGLEAPVPLHRLLDLPEGSL